MVWIGMQIGCRGRNRVDASLEQLWQAGQRALPVGGRRGRTLGNQIGESRAGENRQQGAWHDGRYVRHARLDQWQVTHELQRIAQSLLGVKQETPLAIRLAIPSAR